jgi:hypothetical protein
VTALIPATIDATAFLTGRAEFAALLETIEARGWQALRDADRPFFGQHAIQTPHGLFTGHGFGRLESLQIAYEAALAAERDEEDGP